MMWYYLESFGPTIEKGLPAETGFIEIDHAAPTNSGWTGDSEIVDFEKHSEGIAELDSLAVT